MKLKINFVSWKFCFLELYTKLLKYHKKLKQLIKRAKTTYYKTKFEETKGDIKATWKIIKGELIIQKCVTANSFYNYFQVSIAQKLNNNDDGIGIEPLPNFNAYMSRSVQISLTLLYDCTPDVIHDIISSFSNGKSSDIPIQAIITCSDTLAPSMT